MPFIALVLASGTSIRWWRRRWWWRGRAACPMALSPCSCRPHCPPPPHNCPWAGMLTVPQTGCSAFLLLGSLLRNVTSFFHMNHLSLKTQLRCHFFHKAFRHHPFEITACWTTYMTTLFTLLCILDVSVNVCYRGGWLYPSSCPPSLAAQCLVQN